MPWRDDLRRVTLPDGRTLIGASFRGVPFLVEDSGRSGGRRLVEHEFPYRDEPEFDDLGRRMRGFSLTGYVLGDDYLEQRDALIDALETAGPGELIHPYYADTLRVVCPSFSTDETRREGGRAMFSIEFREAPAAQVAPVVVDDLGGLVEGVALLALTAIIDDLGTTYSVAGQPSFTTSSLAEDATGITSALGELLGPVVTAAGALHDSPDVAIQELAALQAEVDRIEADIDALIREPSDLLARIGEVLQAVEQTAKVAARAVFRALVATHDTTAPPTAAGTTPARVQERANQVALGGAMRQQLLLASAQLIVDVQYATIDDALLDRGDLLDRLDAQILAATDAVYPRLVDVRAGVLRAVPGDEQLARVMTVSRPVATPSLALAYELYGSVDNETDILARNPGQHPGFLAGELKVVSA